MYTNSSSQVRKLKDRYVLESVLNYGGSSIRYLAWDIELQKKAIVIELVNGIVCIEDGTLVVQHAKDHVVFDTMKTMFLTEARDRESYAAHPALFSYYDYD